MWSAVVGFIIGIVLGSFIKATADRMLVNKSLGGRSYCKDCKKTLQWYDLLPLFSFVALQGKCRHCKHPIPFEIFLFEVVLGIVVSILFFVSSPLFIWTTLSFLDLAFKLFLISVAAIIFWVDLKSGLILDKLTYPSAVVAVVYLLVSAQLSSSWIQVFPAFLSALVLSLFFTLIIVFTKGRGMGWGDVKYVFLIGLGLGFPNCLAAVFLAFLSGALVSLFLIALSKKHFGQTIPFGPFLSFGMVVAIIYGPQIISWYLSFT